MWKSILGFLGKLFPGLSSAVLSQAVGLTKAERQQNEFNASQAAMQRQFEAQQMEAANVFNAEEAEKNRAFQAQQSATAYQRQVVDMQAAGVNPALMYGNGASGASTPSGSAASSAMASGSAASGSGRGLSMSELLGVMRVRKEMDLLDAQISRYQKENEESDSRIGLNNEQAGYTHKQAQAYDALTDAQLKQYESALQNDKVRRALESAGISEAEARTSLTLGQAMLNSIDAKTREQMNNLNIRLQIAEIGLRYAQSAEARKRVEHLQADIARIGNEALVLAAQEGKIVNESYNLLLEAGILRSTGKEHEFTVRYQKADRVWRNVGQVFGMTRELVGAAGAAATGLGALRAGSSLRSAAFARTIEQGGSLQAFKNQLELERSLPFLRGFK